MWSAACLQVVVSEAISRRSDESVIIEWFAIWDSIIEGKVNIVECHVISREKSYETIKLWKWETCSTVTILWISSLSLSLKKNGRYLVIMNCKVLLVLRKVQVFIFILYFFLPMAAKDS